MSRRALAPLRDLTIPDAGSTTARDVLSRAIARLLRDVRPIVRDHAALLPPADFQAFDRLLGVLLRDHIGPFASILRRPNVATLIRTLRRPKAQGDAELLRELFALVAVELAAAAELPFEITLHAFPARILSMVMHCSVDLPADADALVLSPGRMRIMRRGEARDFDLDALRAGKSGHEADAASGVRRSFLPIDGGTFLSLEDNNPLFLEEAHPDKSGNAVDLGEVPTVRWVESLQAAFGLVATYLPDLRAEMELYLSQIVPVGSFADKHLSASYREALGTIYLSHHPNLMTMTEALIHEFQHNKLNALLETDDVLENAFSPLYPSPVRPDPRPLHGVLLAVHAFLPVARLYETMIAQGAAQAGHPSFRARFADIVAINREGAAVVLGHGKPTPVGVALLGEIGRWDSHYGCGP